MQVFLFKSMRGAWVWVRRGAEVPRITRLQHIEILIVRWNSKVHLSISWHTESVPCSCVRLQTWPGIPMQRLFPSYWHSFFIQCEFWDLPEVVYHLLVSIWQTNPKCLSSNLATHLSLNEWIKNIEEDLNWFTLAGLNYRVLWWELEAKINSNIIWEFSIFIAVLT